MIKIIKAERGCPAPLKPAGGKRGGSADLREAVRRIIDDVRENGDAAVLRYTRMYDGADMAADSMRVAPEETDCALRRADAGLVQATIRADAFCHHMVRALVGAVVKVGAGRAAVDLPLEVLRSRDRSQAAALVPAHGLTLAAISYPPPPFDARRALRIRAKRTTFGAET